MTQALHETVGRERRDGDPVTTRRTLSTAVHVTETLTVIAEDPRGVPAKVLARRLGQSLDRKSVV